jgi:ABC-type branched-subunit amino acid transport system substrate-binding protein
MPRRVIQIAVGMSVLALLAACSSGSGTSSTASSAGSTASGTGASGSTGGQAAGSEIVVGGLQDGNYAGINTGFEARITRFNAQGGVDGKKIDFVGVLNDNDSETADVSNAQTLVLKDHVFAVAPIADQVLSTGATQLFAQNTTPYIGWGISPAFCGNSWGFPLTGCESSTTWQSTLDLTETAQAIGKPVKGLRVAVIGTNNAGGQVGTESIAATNKIQGADVVYSQASVPQDGTTDYAPYVQALMAADPDVVELVVDFTASVGLTAALKEAGYKGAFWNPDAYVPGLFASQPSLAQALSGSLVVANFPPSEDGSPAALQMEADLKAIGQPASYSLGEAVGWWSAEELIQELQATAAKGPLTQANFEKVMEAGWTITPVTGGVSGLTFPTDQTKSASCYGTLMADGTKYVVKVPFTCDQADTINVSGG